MLVLLRVQNVGIEGDIIAVDPWRIEYIRPAHLEENVCYLNSGGVSWRVEESFDQLVAKINKARKEVAHVGIT